MTSASVGVHDWLDRLPEALARQASLLRQLLAAVEADPRWRVLELQCSVARGAGDEDSDLDAGLGVRDDAWPAAVEDLGGLFTGLRPVVDALDHRLPGWGERPHRRWFVQYADGTQLDIVAQPVSNLRGRVPDAVVLYDPDGHLAEPYEPPAMRPTAEDVREWTLLGWSALGDLAKYLRRGSVWEAYDRLQEARAEALRLWAVAEGAAYPLFGLTSLLDHAGATLPDGLEATVARPVPAELHRAALASADLLDAAERRARQAIGAPAAPPPLAAFVRDRLRAVAP